MKSYKTYQNEFWTPGRQDDDKEYWGSWVRPVHIDQVEDPSSSSEHSRGLLLGFACDEGVKRNYGHPGASAGPEQIRCIFKNLPRPDHSKHSVLDAGDIICPDTDLELAQSQLAGLTRQIVEKNYIPVLLGGGHETAWGHFQGLLPGLSTQKSLGIINFDAHFDLRPLENQKAHSGSPFRQILSRCKEDGIPCRYNVLGVQEHANSKSLYAYFSDHGSKYLSAETMFQQNLAELFQFVSQILDENDQIYLSICMDVFSSSVAPGVSAVQPEGIFPFQVQPLIRQIAKSGKLSSAEIVEFCPKRDINDSTGKLAASLLSTILANLAH